MKKFLTIVCSVIPTYLFFLNSVLSRTRSCSSLRVDPASDKIVSMAELRIGMLALFISQGFDDSQKSGGLSLSKTNTSGR